jgi:hypothetical protein
MRRCSLLCKWPSSSSSLDLSLSYSALFANLESLLVLPPSLASVGVCVCVCVCASSLSVCLCLWLCCRAGFWSSSALKLPPKSLETLSRFLGRGEFPFVWVLCELHFPSGKKILYHIWACVEVSVVLMTKMQEKWPIIISLMQRKVGIFSAS